MGNSTKAANAASKQLQSALLEVSLLRKKAAIRGIDLLKEDANCFFETSPTSFALECLDAEECELAGIHEASHHRIAWRIVWNYRTIVVLARGLGLLDSPTDGERKCFARLSEAEQERCRQEIGRIGKDAYLRWLLTWGYGPTDAALEPLAVRMKGELKDLLLNDIGLEARTGGGDKETVEPNGSEDVGVSLYDAILHFEDDEIAARAQVKRIQDSKQELPAKIGKCPHDGRVQLHLLPDVVKFLKEYLGLGKTEKDRLSAHLKTKVRHPRAESIRK